MSGSRQSLLQGLESACKFCDIANKTTESAVVFEDGSSIAFLDIRPLFPGHVLLVPKAHYPALKDVPQEIVNVLFNNVKMLSGAVQSGLGADGAFIALNENVSQSIPHLHIHIVPRRFKDGLKGFFWPRYKYKDENEIKDVQKKIINAVKNM
jgi:histidine triad (HIT) family protein